MGAENLLFDSDAMWAFVLAGLAACLLSRGNGPPVSRETPDVSSGEDADPSANFPLEALFGQQAPMGLNGEEITEFLADEDPSDFLVDVSGFVGKV